MSEISQTHEAPVPKYTKTDENGFSARLETFQKEYPNYPIIPVTKHPDIPDATLHDRGRSLSSTSDSRQSAEGAAHALQADIVTALFAYISSRDTAAVHHLIRNQNLISPNCPNPTGETPLLASIRARSAPTARTLLTLGADPNLPGTPAASAWDSENASAGDRITPLMLAAATGQLAIVRLLVGEFDADDAVVGAKGETALRLAAKAGHRDVVRYLPARRGGAWRRLRCSREVAALRKAVVTAGKVVRFLGWDMPRCLVVDVPWEVGKLAWRRRQRIWELVVRAVRAVPRVMKGVVEGVWSGVRALPRLVWRVVMWISRVVPRAWGIVWKGLVDGMKKVGFAVGFAAQRLVSVLHSFFAAVINRLREIKLKDVGHDLLVAMEALLVNLPQAVRTFMSQSVVVVGRAAKACFSNYWVRALLKVVSWLVCVVPKTIWSMLESLWACLGRGLEELITLVNPKLVSSKRNRS